MEELKKPLTLCSSCRRVFVGGDFKLNEGCPGCNSMKVVAVFSVESLVDDMENSNAFQALIQVNATSDQLEEVGVLMGVEGGLSEVRKDSKHIDALSEWKRENGCYF
jgi:predicted  nucleic acid-binding Zn-ribbon protein